MSKVARDSRPVEPKLVGFGARNQRVAAAAQAEGLLGRSRLRRPALRHDLLQVLACVLLNRPPRPVRSAVGNGALVSETTAQATW